MQPVFFQRHEHELTSEQVQQLLQDRPRSPAKRQRVMPPRGSKTRAVERMREIHEWETCSESSALFQQAAAALDAELAGLQPEERADPDSEPDIDDAGSILDSAEDSDDSANSFVSRDSWSSRDTEYEPSESTESTEPTSAAPSEPATPTTFFAEPCSPNHHAAYSTDA